MENFHWFVETNFERGSIASLLPTCICIYRSLSFKQDWNNYLIKFSIKITISNFADISKCYICYTVSKQNIQNIFVFLWEGILEHKNYTTIKNNLLLAINLKPKMYDGKIVSILINQIRFNQTVSKSLK